MKSRTDDAHPHSDSDKNNLCCSLRSQIYPHIYKLNIDRHVKHDLAERLYINEHRANNLKYTKTQTKKALIHFSVFPYKTHSIFRDTLHISKGIFSHAKWTGWNFLTHPRRR